MCSIQKQHIKTDAGNDDKSAIVGFQWKPHGNTISHEYSKKGLGAVGAQQDPPIRVIYLTRNPIDRKLSNLRHEEQNLEIPAHCEVGDEECLRQHETSFEKGGIEFPVGKDLLLMLERKWKLDRRLRYYFNRYGVKYIQYMWSMRSCTRVTMPMNGCVFSSFWARDHQRISLWRR